MRKIMIAPIVAVAVASVAGFAMASDDSPGVDVPKEQWMSIAQIAERLASEGYEVREIEVEDGAYEVSAIDGDGKRFKAYLHPATGEVIKDKSDDN
jgi:hypothetical protein